MQDLLKSQKEAFLGDMFPSAEVRKERIQRFLNVLVASKDKIVQGMVDDYSGHRSSRATITWEFLGSISHLKNARDNVEKWMERQSVTLGDTFNMENFGAKGWLQHSPKGVVGIMPSWTTPVFSLCSPLSGALAAGNRVMIQCSKKTPSFAKALKEVLEGEFDAKEMIVCEGDKSLASLHLNHLVFSGDFSDATKVMEMAANHFVPVSLFVATRNPGVLVPGAVGQMKQVAIRVAAASLINAGQHAGAIGHFFLPKGALDDFVTHWKSSAATLYKKVLPNDEYIPLIDKAAFERISSYVEEAKKHGCAIHQHAPDGEMQAEPPYKYAPTLIVDAPEDSAVMKDVISGPVLPVTTYDSLNEVITMINKGRVPSALYYFGDDREEQEDFLQKVCSGAVGLNDATFQLSVDGIPYPAEGMGAAHGIYGFETFSHPKGLFQQAPGDMVSGGMRTPYASDPIYAVQMSMVNAN